MLILTRKRNQSIVIGDFIRITILGNDRNGEIRVGIEAPKDVRVMREEIIDRYAARNKYIDNKTIA